MAKRRKNAIARPTKTAQNESRSWRNIKVQTLSNKELHEMSQRFSQGISVSSVLNEMNINTTDRAKNKINKQIPVIVEHPKFPVIKSSDKISENFPLLASKEKKTPQKKLVGTLMTQNRKKIGKNVEVKQVYPKFPKIGNLRDSKRIKENKPAILIKNAKFEEMINHARKDNSNQKQNYDFSVDAFEPKPQEISLHNKLDSKKFKNSREQNDKKPEPLDILDSSSEKNVFEDSFATKNRNTPIIKQNIEESIPVTKNQENTTLRLKQKPKIKQKRNRICIHHSEAPSRGNERIEEVIYKRGVKLKVVMPCLVERIQKSQLIRKNQGKKATRRPLMVCEKKEFLQGEKKADH